MVRTEGIEPIGVLVKNQVPCLYATFSGTSVVNEHRLFSKAQESNYKIKKPFFLGKSF